MTANEMPQRRSLILESWLFASQLLTHWRREPVVPIQALVFPTVLLITYYLLVGKSIVRLTGTGSLYGLVPTCAVAGAMLGALAAGMAIPFERDGGLLSQLWVLPVHRASALTGRLLAEAIRTLVGSTLITAVGIGLGLRFNAGWLAVIPFVLVPVAVVIVYSMIVIAISVRSRQGTVLMWLGVPSVSAVFASSGSPPVTMLPAWLRPLIEFQPMAPTIGFMRALAQGGPLLWPFLLSSMWAIGLAAVFAPLAISGYRAAAASPR